MLIQNLQSLFAKYWIFVVTKKNKYIYIYTYTYRYTHIYIYIYIFIHIDIYIIYIHTNFECLLYLCQIYILLIQQDIFLNFESYESYIYVCLGKSE